MQRRERFSLFPPASDSSHTHWLYFLGFFRLVQRLIFLTFSFKDHQRTSFHPGERIETQPLVHAQWAFVRSLLGNLNLLKLRRMGINEALYPNILTTL